MKRSKYDEFSWDHMYLIDKFGDKKGNSISQILMGIFGLIWGVGMIIVFIFYFGI